MELGFRLPDSSTTDVTSRIDLQLSVLSCDLFIHNIVLPTTATAFKHHANSGMQFRAIRERSNFKSCALLSFLIYL